MSNSPDCPFCNPKPWPKPEAECVLGKPLWMVIPPGGMHMACPAHAEGHHIHGSSWTLCCGGGA